MKYSKMLFMLCIALVLCIFVVSQISYAMSLSIHARPPAGTDAKAPAVEEEVKKEEEKLSYESGSDEGMKEDRMVSEKLGIAVAGIDKTVYNCKIPYEGTGVGKSIVDVQFIYGPSINVGNANKLLEQLQTWNEQDVPVVALFANQEEADRISTIFKGQTGLELGDLVYKDIMRDAETGMALTADQEKTFENVFKQLGKGDLFYTVDYANYQKIIAAVKGKV